MSDDHAMTANSSTLYVAVIGDLVHSREVEDREAVQKALASTLEELNERFHDGIASKFLITLGDEFQGLLFSSAEIDQVFWAYQRLMHALVDTRFGFGVGTLATSRRETAIAMDGPCFHAARTALERAQAEERRFCFEVAADPGLGEALTLSSRLLDHVLGQWSEVQWETVTLLAERHTRVAVAEERGVRRQSVDDVVRSSFGVECLESWRGLGEIVRHWMEGRRGG